VFFRDWVLSDKVGFQYSGWDPESAVEDFVNTILSVRDQVGGGRILVIALDGENAWEHYPNDAIEFLTGPYQKLSELQSQGLIRTVTIREYLENYDGKEKAEAFPVAEVPVLDLKNKDISTITDYSDLPMKYVSQKFPEGSWAGEDNPWNDPNGFSLQIIEVYIDTVEDGCAMWASVGSNVEIADVDAWGVCPPYCGLGLW